MSFSRKKRSLILILIPLLIILILSLIGIYYFINANRLTDSKQVSTKIKEISQKNKSSLDYGRIEKQLEILNNEKLSSKERYIALENIAFYFATSYAAVKNPEYRKFVSSLGDYAKQNFPDQYKDSTFNLGCSDAQCGEKPDQEFKQIQKEINEAGIEKAYLDTINRNLEQAGFIPSQSEIDKTEKKFGYSLVIDNLLFFNNPKASAAAEHLREYANKKYNFDL